jgi:RNA polymerase sigma-70 factor (ECF subfamily)
VQLSANLGIGAEFKLGQHLGLYVDPSLRYYFDNGQPKSIRTSQPLMLGFEMGLRVNL